jgi:hypothetical protein
VATPCDAVRGHHIRLAVTVEITGRRGRSPRCRIACGRGKTRNALRLRHSGTERQNSPQHTALSHGCPSAGYLALPPDCDSWLFGAERCILLPAQNFTRPRARVPALVQHHHAIHQHKLHPTGVTLRVFKSGVIDDGFRIENSHIRPHTGAQ